MAVLPHIAEISIVKLIGLVELFKHRIYFVDSHVEFVLLNRCSISVRVQVAPPIQSDIASAYVCLARVQKRRPMLIASQNIFCILITIKSHALHYN